MILLYALKTKIPLFKKKRAKKSSEEIQSNLRAPKTKNLQSTKTCAAEGTRTPTDHSTRS